MLKITKVVQIQERVSRIQMLLELGMEDILYYMRYLQLNWLGKMRRMEVHRLPRRMLASWLLEHRSTNYPQSYWASIKKALRAVEVGESDWKRLSLDEVEWNRVIRRTDGERDKEKMEAVRLASLPPSQYAAAVAHVHGNVDGVNFRGTPASTQRRSWALGGQSRTPKKDRWLNPVESVDFRDIDPRNVHPAGVPRIRYTGSDPESIHAEFLRKVGNRPPGGTDSDFWDIYNVRLGKTGIYYWRRQQENRCPTHRYSWMLPMLDKEKGRDPSKYVTRSYRPPPLPLYDDDAMAQAPPRALCATYPRPLPPVRLEFQYPSASSPPPVANIPIFSSSPNPPSPASQAPPCFVAGRYYND